MVYGYEGKLQSGDFTLRLWPDQVFFFFSFFPLFYAFLNLFLQICKTMGTTCINWDVGAPSLTFLIPSSPHPIVSLPPPPPPSSLPPSNSSFPPLNSSFTLPPSSASNTDKRREKKGEILHRELGGGRSRLSLLYSHRLEEVLIFVLFCFVFLSFQKIYSFYPNYSLYPLLRSHADFERIWLFLNKQHSK